ncbi:MAG: hypothetical protein U9R15_09735 [Chloroflexota bacterium]|nr:hypothetical protein [Chloroflexota bacterium]
MADETDHSLRLGRLEDKFALHEPILINLHSLVSVSDEISKIHTELQALRDSKIATQEKLVAMLNDQEKNYQNILTLCDEKAELSKNCPIKSAMVRIGALEGSLENVNKVLDTLKVKGWDILLRIIPWFLLFGVTVWVAMKN